MSFHYDGHVIWVLSVVFVLTGPWRLQVLVKDYSPVVAQDCFGLRWWRGVGGGGYAWGVVLCWLSRDPMCYRRRGRKPVLPRQLPGTVLSFFSLKKKKFYLIHFSIPFGKFGPPYYLGIAANPPGFPGNLPDFETCPGIPDLKFFSRILKFGQNKNQKTTSTMGIILFHFVRDCGN